MAERWRVYVGVMEANLQTADIMVHLLQLRLRVVIS